MVELSIPLPQTSMILTINLNFDGTRNHGSGDYRCGCWCWTFCYVDTSYLQVLEVVQLNTLVSGLLIYIHACRFCFAPYQVLKKCGIKGPMPVPIIGNYLIFKMVS